MFILTNRPYLTYGINRQLNEVILSAENFRSYMRLLTRDANWSILPDYLHDAFDRVLIIEVQAKKATPCVFEGTLAVERALCL
jgi:hypothetical protein